MPTIPSTHWEKVECHTRQTMHHSSAASVASEFQLLMDILHEKFIKPGSAIGLAPADAAAFSENVCQNEIIGSHQGRGVLPDPRMSILYVT